MELSHATTAHATIACGGASDNDQAPTDLPTSGYALIVDGHAKREIKTQDSAIQAAKDLKTRFPSLQIKVYDAEAKRAEQIGIELAPA